MEHVREKYDFVFNKDKFSLDDYNDSINFGDLPASSPPPSGKILYFIFKHALTYCEKKMFWWLRKTFEIHAENVPNVWDHCTGTICSNLQEKLEFFSHLYCAEAELESISIFCSCVCTRFSLNVLLFISSTDLLLLSI